MNGTERKVFYLSLNLLVLGIVVRFLPWGLPAIDTFQVGDRVIVANEMQNDVSPDSLGNLELVVAESPPHDLVGTDKLIKSDSRKSKKKPPKVQLPVHINSAGIDELCALKGVGPKLAEKIVAHREASGPFKSEKDLQKVPGIGKKKLEGMLPGVIFD